MRINDAGFLSSTDEPTNGTLVLPDIKPGKLSVLQIEPEDSSLDAVLAALTLHERPVVIILPQQGQLFSQEQDFVRLRSTRTPSIISFVIPQERMALVAKFASNQGFRFTSSFAQAKASFLQPRQISQHSQLLADQYFPQRGEDVTQQQSKYVSLQADTWRDRSLAGDNIQNIDGNAPVPRSRGLRYDPTTPFPETFLQSAQPWPQSQGGSLAGGNLWNTEVIPSVQTPQGAKRDPAISLSGILSKPAQPELQPQDKPAGNSQSIDGNMPIWTQWGAEHDPANVLFPEAFLTTAQLQNRKRSRRLITFVVVAAILGIVFTVLFPYISARQAASSHQNVAVPTSMGQFSFMSSGQLDPSSSTGLNDLISLNLNSLTPPHSGMSYFAWLLSDQTQDSIPPILLGKFQPIGGKAQISYQDPQHVDLLVNYSRLLITEQGNTIDLTSPPLDPKNWRYQGSIPDIPTPGDQEGYSLLSHVRHLLAKDPDITDLGLSGGLNVWLYRNTGKVFEWSNGARDNWANNNPNLLRPLIDRVIEYTDGQAYAWQDLPADTPWLVDPKAGRPGLIDVSTRAEVPLSYISHIKLHLAGIVDAPGHTSAQRQLAEQVDDELTTVEASMRKVRSDAVQLARMSNVQLKSQNALSLLNDMQINASHAYIGGQGSAGVVQICDALQGLATVSITRATPNGP